MNEEPVDKYFGVPMSEWIARVPNELSIDAVGLWQIIPVGADSFSLSGEQLDDFTRRCIVALLQNNAFPVKASFGNPRWVRETRYHGSPEQMAYQIINDWKADAAVADQDGLWFSRL